MCTSTLASFVSRVKIAYAHNDLSVIVRYSKLLVNILDILIREGCIIGYNVGYSSSFCGLNITVFLKYYNNKSVIRKIKVISTPGLRVY